MNISPVSSSNEPVKVGYNRFPREMTSEQKVP